MLPPRILAAYRDARKVVEIGAGTHWGNALGVAGALPGCEVMVTDTDPRVLQAPPPLACAIDDVFQPRRAVYEDAALLYTVRPPEEVQSAVARLGRHVGADVAILPLGQELARFEGWRAEVVGGWHWLRTPS